MAAVLKVVDERMGTAQPARREGVLLRLASERTTGRDIIRSRVVAEVEEINRAKERKTERILGRSYLILAEPEARLNSNSNRAWSRTEPADVEAEVARAVAAFTHRRFIMLLDDRQIDGLDDPVGLGPESEVVFVHLTPLKGG